MLRCLLNPSDSKVCELSEVSKLTESLLSFLISVLSFFLPRLTAAAKSFDRHLLCDTYFFVPRCCGFLALGDESPGRMVFRANIQTSSSIFCREISQRTVFKFSLNRPLVGSEFRISAAFVRRRGAHVVQSSARTGLPSIGGVSPTSAAEIFCIY